MKKKRYHTLTTKARRLNFRDVDHMLDDLLRVHHGVVSEVALYLECSTQAVYQRIREREAKGQ